MIEWKVMLMMVQLDERMNVGHMMWISVFCIGEEPLERTQPFS